MSEEKSQDYKDGYEAGRSDGYIEGTSEGCDCSPEVSDYPSENEIARYLVAEKLCPDMLAAETVAKDMLYRLFS